MGIERDRYVYVSKDEVCSMLTTIRKSMAAISNDKYSKASYLRYLELGKQEVIMSNVLQDYFRIEHIVGKATREFQARV